MLTESGISSCCPAKSKGMTRLKTWRCDGDSNVRTDNRVPKLRDMMSVTKEGIQNDLRETQPIKIAIEIVLSCELDSNETVNREQESAKQ
jgi:hypothetical protein